MLSKTFLILIILFSIITIVTHAEEMEFVVYGIGETKQQYPSLDWPKPINEYAWRVVILNLEETFYGYIDLTNLELVRVVNYSGYMTFEVENYTGGIIKSVGDYFLLPMPSNKEKVVLADE